MSTIFAGSALVTGVLVWSVGCNATWLTRWSSVLAAIRAAQCLPDRFAHDILYALLAGPGIRLAAAMTGTPMESAESTPWLLLIYTVPSQPSRKRATVWRALMPARTSATLGWRAIRRRRASVTSSSCTY